MSGGIIKIFGQRKLVKDISANAVQTLAVQIFGILIFYWTSKYLPKEQFGDFNWSMATAATLIAICSLGLDLIFVKKVAAGADVLVYTRMHLFHTILVGIVLASTAAIFAYLAFPSFKVAHPVFLFVLISLSVSNIANSFKLSLNGLEAYGLLARISLIANTVKLGLVILLYLFFDFSVITVAFAYIIASVSELFFSYLLLKRKLQTVIRPVWKIEEYKFFILESLPQLGVVLFDSALARIDWILLGVIGTVAATAEYSFAYKIFEISKLPLLIIAPVLLTRFSRMLGQGEFQPSQTEQVKFYFKLEMFVIMFIPIFLILTWSPLIDYFTDNKYGRVNEYNYLILACCVPMHAVINFLWTVGFVQGQLKTIMLITIAVSVINILLNLALIPVFAAEGAAAAFLFSTIIQLVLYIRFITQNNFRIKYMSALFSFLAAVGSVALGRLLINNLIFAVITSFTVFVVAHMVFGGLNITQIKQLLPEKEGERG